jgi:glycosyltransferase involved in cell wall biosynthesis
MKVVVSAGGRFHALHLAGQLEKRQMLHRLFSFDYQSSDKSLVNPAYITSITSCKILNMFFEWFRLAKFFDRSRFNTIKDTLFDKRVAKKLPALQPIDLFVVWSGYGNKSIPAAQSAGAKIIVESGSCHIKVQQKILEEEYARWRIPYTPISQDVIDRYCFDYEQADVIMTLSTFAKNSFISQGFAPNKILCVSCGIDVDFFAHAQPNLKKDSLFRVICVGLVSLRKGIHHLIQAWHAAGLPIAKAELVIVGAMQHDFTHIAKKLPTMPNICFIGPVDRKKLTLLYQSASLFVLPSLEDGFGMVLGEAMASGLPVIGSTSSAAPDIITHGQQGFLFTPGDIQDLASKIGWCYNHQHDCLRMGQKGKQWIKKFSWDQYGKTIVKTYQTFLETQNP